MLTRAPGCTIRLLCGLLEGTITKSDLTVFFRKPFQTTEILLLKATFCKVMWFYRKVLFVIERDSSNTKKDCKSKILPQYHLVTWHRKTK